MSPRDTADRIVDAAYEILVAGTPKLTLDRVAESAGVNKVTIFRHFPGGRSELLLQVYARVAERYLTRMAEHVAEQPTLAEAMVEGIIHTLEQTHANPTIAPLFAPEADRRIGAIGPTSNVLAGLVRQVWGPLLADAQRRGEARADLSLQVFVEFMLRMTFSLLSDPPVGGRSLQETRSFLRQVITPFVAGPTPIDAISAGMTTPTPAPPSLPALSAIRVRAADPIADRERAGDERPIADRLIENAAALFREKSFDRSSTRELADRLGISQPSLYHHVGTKHELLERVCIESLDRMIEEVQARAPFAASPIEELIGVHMSVLVRDREMHLARVLEQDALDEAASGRVAERYAAYGSLIGAIIEAEQAAGRVRADLDPGEMVIALLNLLNWSVFWLEPGDQDGATAAAGLLARVFLEGVKEPLPAARARARKRARP